MNARDPTSSKPGPNTRGQAAIVHVDLGADLKSAVCSAAMQAGVKPSEWMRSQLAHAFSAAEPGLPAQPEPDLRRRRGPAACAPTAASKSHQLGLQADDLAWLDQIARAGGFRSRPAALRYALRLLASDEGLEALNQLPTVTLMLVKSNMTLQTALRLPDTFPSEALGQTQLEAKDKLSLRREIGAHLELVSQLLAALRPLLAVPATVQGRGVR